VHPTFCACGACRQGSALFADVAGEVASEDAPAEVAAEATAEAVPAEVDALDGVESSDEAHNVDRPERKELKKKRAPKGKDLSEFKVGSMVSGSVKSIQSYGAFVDIGASTDGLLHISQLSAGYVASVGEILTEGQAVEVRIVSIDASKGQVGLSLMTEEQAATSNEPRGKPRQQRRDDSSTLSALMEKGWEPSAFVEGTVVSTVDFGAFVRVSASTLNSECEGEFDGLVHISALAPRRVNSVTDIVSTDQKVQVRVKSIAGNKVSLTMISVEDEDAKKDFSGPPEPQGAKDWKESLAKMDDTQPVFKNSIVVEDRRK
jgi:elongation factor Ts